MSPDQSRTVEQCRVIREGCRGIQVKVILALIAIIAGMGVSALSFANGSSSKIAAHEEKLLQTDKNILRVYGTMERLENKIDDVLMKVSH